MSVVVGYPAHPFEKTGYQASHTALRAAGHKLDQQEDLTSQSGYSDEEDMGELSDSHSSHTSWSRPTTPLSQSDHPTPHVRTQKSASPQPDLPYAIAHKAERILGLSPGTLPHARAALESALEEVRRLDHPIAPLVPYSYGGEESNTPKEGGMRGRFDRTLKAMSVALPHGTKIPGVVVGAGGKEEEMRREKVRKANDGVLYWQKEVARLKAEVEESNLTVKSKKRR